VTAKATALRLLMAVTGLMQGAPANHQHPPGSAQGS